MVREVLAFVGFFSLVGTLSIGCSSGFSEERAKLFCDQERTPNASGCHTEAVYEQCLSCYQECGNDCVRIDSCPGGYTCSGDSNTGNNGAGGSK